MAGSRTVHKETRTYTGNRLNPFLPHVMASEQESQRPLLTPDEVMRLPEEDTLIFAGGQPIRGVKTPYYLDPEFTRRTSIPAPEESDRMSLENKPWTQIVPSARASAEPEGPADLASEVLPLDADVDEPERGDDESSGGPLAI